MKQINFSDVGVVVNSMEELDGLYMTYTALGISFSEEFKVHTLAAQVCNLVGYFIQSTRSDLKTMLDGDYLCVSLINYPVTYVMDSIDFAVAYHLLKSNQSDELTAHLDKYCKEFK